MVLTLFTIRSPEPRRVQGRKPNVVYGQKPYVRKILIVTAINVIVINVIVIVNLAIATDRPMPMKKMKIPVDVILLINNAIATEAEPFKISSLQKYV